MSDTENAIEVKDLSKEYMLYSRPADRLVEALGLSRRVRHTVHKALQNVDLTVKRGESIGIIGKNGSGKSTILKI
ncbi:MAG: ATP-binding cassette domain-containing protein, partial [Lachnospiraceae bacterium]|nr:ATP-binding cassette domain-containing protein [Lachnospiraceae bacterium]